MKEQINHWYQLLRDFAAFDGPLPSLGQYQFDLALHALFAVTTLALAGLAVWLARHTVSSSLRRMGAVLLVCMLVALPGYVYVNNYRVGIYLLMWPNELLAILRFFPEQLEQAVTQHRIAATGTFWLALLACIRALNAATPAHVPGLLLVFVAMLAPWPVLYAGQVAWHKLGVLQEYRTGKAMFDAQCQTAGLTVHQKVDDVAGVRLGRMRAELPDTRFADKTWADAGIPLDRIGQRYVAAFLDFDFSNSDVQNAGFSISGFDTVTMGGYRFVDVPGPDGSYQRWRLKGFRPSQGHVQETIATEEAARHVVSIDALDTPALRAHWVAGSRMSVTDASDQRLLGELRAFAYAPPQRKLDAPPQERNWYWALTCPPYRDIPGAMARMAVEQVLTPTRKR
ncbi:MAG: hypothetical protein E6Q78_04615 [Rhodoferax sp.]|nr:MAG: hypothetical protein E6Q78_04615 [Rhodoferax sp.]